MLVAILLLLAAAPRPQLAPTVHVELDHAGDQVVSSDTVRMRRWLLVRLVEEGYTLVPASEASQFLLSVVATEAGWVLQVTGTETRTDFVAASSSAVAQLEVLHRAIALLGDSQPAPGEAAPPPKLVTVTVRAASAEVGPERLEQVQERLVEELERAGIAVTSKTAEPVRAVCARVAENTVELHDAETLPDCLRKLEPGSPMDAPGTFSGTSGEDAVLARVRSLSEQWPEPDAPRDELPEPAPSTATAATRPDPPAETSREPWRLEPRVHTAVGWSKRGDSDLLWRFGLDVGSNRGFGARLQVDSLFPDPSGLSVFELQTQLGPTYQLPITESLSVQSGVLGGIHLHRYEYSSTDRDTLTTWVGSVPVELRYELDALSLGLTAHWGMTGQTPLHQVRGVTVWRRGQSMWGVAFGVGWP